MNPEMVSAMNAVSLLIKEAGSWPVGSVLLTVLFGPWIMTFFINRSLEKRFEGMKQMYQSNVKLVESFDKIASIQNDVILLNTAKWTEALDKINLNQFCPLARIRKQRMENVDP